MNNTTSIPDSVIVQQFAEFLNRMEDELDRALTRVDELKDEDPELGYARAVGCAKGYLESLKISAQVNRRYFLDA